MARQVLQPMNPMRKEAIVLHSGGMDSSLCLAYAIKKFGADQVLALNIHYGQRNHAEIKQAELICQHFAVDQYHLDVDFLGKITQNAMLDSLQPIKHEDNKAPNTFVLGRNGLFVRLAAVLGHQYGAKQVYTGVIEVEAANSGYPDCTRRYMDLMQQVLSIDLSNPQFKIRTPLVFMTKAQTMEFGYQLGILPFLLENTITCYEGIARAGCKICPACQLRNQGIQEFLQRYPDFAMPYAL